MIVLGFIIIHIKVKSYIGQLKKLNRGIGNRLKGNTNGEKTYEKPKNEIHTSLQFGLCRGSFCYVF